MVIYFTQSPVIKRLFLLTALVPHFSGLTLKNVRYERKPNVFSLISIMQIRKEKRNNFARIIGKF